MSETVVSQGWPAPIQGFTISFVYHLAVDWGELNVYSDFIKLAQPRLSFLYSFQDLESSSPDFFGKVKFKCMCLQPNEKAPWPPHIKHHLFCSSIWIFYLLFYIKNHEISWGKNSLKIICFPTEILFLWLIDPLDSGCHGTISTSASGFWKMLCFFFSTHFQHKCWFSPRYYILTKSWRVFFLYCLNLSL